MLTQYFRCRHNFSAQRTEHTFLWSIELRSTGGCRSCVATHTNSGPLFCLYTSLNFTPSDLNSAEDKLLSLLKKRNLITSEGGNCWIQKMKEILKETQTLQSIAQLAVGYCDRGKQKTVCCPAGQHLIIKQVFLRKSRESNKANWINVHFSWLYRRRKITHWKILSRDMRVRFELFYFLLLSISLNILFFSRGGKWGDAGWENCLYFLCAFVTFLWDYFATWEIILKCEKNRNEKININLSTNSRAKHKWGLATIQRTLWLSHRCCDALVR